MGVLIVVGIAIVFTLIFRKTSNGQLSSIELALPPGNHIENWQIYDDQIAFYLKPNHEIWLFNTKTGKLIRTIKPVTFDKDK